MGVCLYSAHMHTSIHLSIHLSLIARVITFIVLCAVLGRGSSVYQVAGALVIMLGAWVVLLPSGGGAEDEDEDGSGSRLEFTANMLYMASNIPIALR